jgi:hypothetical protein
VGCGCVGSVEAYGRSTFDLTIAGDCIDPRVFVLEDVSSYVVFPLP